MAQMSCAWDYCIASLILLTMHCHEVFATDLHCSLYQNAPEVLAAGSLVTREEWHAATIGAMGRGPVSGPVLPSAAVSLIEQAGVRLQSVPSSHLEFVPGYECADPRKPWKEGGVSCIIPVFQVRPAVPQEAK